MAFCVLTPDVSVVALNVRLATAVKHGEIVLAIKEAATGEMAGVLDWIKEEADSTDLVTGQASYFRREAWLSMLMGIIVGASGMCVN